MKYHSGVTIKDVARELGLSEDAVWRRVNMLDSVFHTRVRRGFRGQLLLDQNDVEVIKLVEKLRTEEGLSLRDACAEAARRLGNGSDQKIHTSNESKPHTGTDEAMLHHLQNMVRGLQAWVIVLNVWLVALLVLVCLIWLRLRG